MGMLMNLEQSGSTRVDWESTENHVFLNPRLPRGPAQELLDLLEAFAADFQGHLFLLSSGTTAQSTHDLKWIALSKEAFLASAAAVNQHLQSGSSDRWLHSLPDFHVGGLSIWARSHLSGASVVKKEGWNPLGFVEQVKTQQVTLASLVPTQVFDLVQARFQAPESLRALFVGGGALAIELYERALELGWPLLPTYGMTEAGSQIATAPLPEPSRRLSELQVLRHFEVRLSPEGLLQLKGPSLLSAMILRGPERKPQRVDFQKGEWFQTQDRASIQGRSLQILGRVGDFVKIGGESVEMARLRDLFESLRLELGIEKDVALIPVPDARLGHVIHAMGEEGLTDLEVDLLSHQYHSQVLAFEKIRKWHRLSVLPRTSLGKLIYSECIQKISF